MMSKDGYYTVDYHHTIAASSRIEERIRSRSSGPPDPCFAPADEPTPASLCSTCKWIHYVQ